MSTGEHIRGMIVKCINLAVRKFFIYILLLCLTDFLVIFLSACEEKIDSYPDPSAGIKDLSLLVPGPVREYFVS